MEDTVVYRLKDRNKLGSWTIKDGVAERNGLQERIHYRPGAKSIYDSDNEKNPIKPVWVTFTHNNDPNDPACELTVPKANGLLIKFLETHWFYRKEYERFSKEDVYKLNEEKYSKIEKALGLINEADFHKHRAICMSILGMDYFNASDIKCAADMKEKAVRNPDAVIQAFEDENYESKYIVSLAFCRGFIKTNPTSTAVIWEDGGKIINVAPGESPVEKLAEYVRQNGKDSVLLLQTIGEKLETDMPENNIHASLYTQDDINERDREIAELRAQLAEKVNAEPKKQNPTADNPEGLHPTELLEVVTQKYKEKFNKNVPANKKNDVDWISNKLKEEFD